MANSPGLNGRKRRTRNAAQNLALKLNISEEELAIKAGELFFLQDGAPMTPRATAEDLAMPLEAGIEDQLGMGELTDVLFTTKTNSAPGPDRVTYQALRNIPEEAKKRLLDKYKYNRYVTLMKSLLSPNFSYALWSTVYDDSTFNDFPTSMPEGVLRELFAGKGMKLRLIDSRSPSSRSHFKSGIVNLWHLTE
ncbi:hypothetical protein ISCGN_024501 [Ixodes scapularis]